MNHLGIKNLSIALEALPRINSYEALNASRKINSLLDKEIEAAKEPTSPPAKSPFAEDDNIPF